VEFPDFVYRHRGGTATWIHRSLVRDVPGDWLNDPDALFHRSDAEVIKDQRKIKVARVPVTLAGGLKGIYVKRFNVFSWRYRLGSVFMASGAVRALRGAQLLSQENVPAACALAAVEFRSCGMVTKSFFLTAEIAGGRTADAYWREELQRMASADAPARRRMFLQRLALLFRRLHDLNIYHNDLKDANILVVGGDDHRPESLFLLDLEGIRRYRSLSARRRIKNLVQLNRTLGCYLRRIDKCVFAKSYLGEGFRDRRQKRRWIFTVLARSGEKDRQKSGNRNPATAWNA
jgi:tRNA A-37 threonylcarbamoyl transferase component Bud32